MTSDEFKQLTIVRIANLKKLSKEKNGVEDNLRDILPNGTIEVKIDIPLRKNGRDFFNLRESVLLQAERENKIILLDAPAGSRLVTPQEWRTGAQIMYQRFKYETPLKMYGNYIFLLDN